MSSERKPRDDRELEDFLSGKHPVGRAYREVSGSQTAPRELDDAILRLAREHAAPKPDAMPLRRRPRWIQPLALAATLALSVGVLMNIWREPALRQQVVPTEGGGAAPAPAAEPIEAPKPKRAIVAPEEPEALESRRAAPFPGKAAGPAERGRDAESLADTVSPSAVAPRGDGAMAPAPPSPPPAAAPAAQASGAAAPRPDVDPHQFGRLGGDDDRYSFHQYLEKEAVVEQPEQKKREADRTPAMAKQKMQESMAADAAAPGAAESASREDGDAEDVLIERARAAVARGDEDEARRLVAELRRRYPDAPLPEDLRALAPPAPAP